MRSHDRLAGWGNATTAILLAALPLMLGQGCPNVFTPIPPITDVDLIGQDVPSTGNTPPTFAFTNPLEDISLEVGDTVQITWTVTDPDSNATIQLLLDPDGDFGNDNDRIIAPLIFENSTQRSFDLNTAALSLPPASYRIIARVNDGANPEQIIVASGNILLFGPGLLIGNKAPLLVVTEPTQSFAASQGDRITIRYCGSDRDDASDGSTPQVVLLLDLDDNPRNDLLEYLDEDSNPNTGIALGARSRTALSTLCSANVSFPKLIPGAIVLGCASDNDCVATTNSSTFVLQVDVGLIPPTATGDPYRVRGTMWDFTNRPVSFYAPGSIAVTALGSGTIDLSEVGRTISGSKFYGFDAFSYTGSLGAEIGDFDGDSVDDMVIVSRLGHPGGSVQPAGTAHLILGLPTGQKFGSQVSLNSVSTTVRGTQFFMPPQEGTEGIKSITRIDDLDQDNLPDFMLGMPWVPTFSDPHIDDPCACSCSQPGCYGDLYPNPFSADCLGRLITDFDHRDFPGSCSNDQDDVAYPINGGYTILVGSSQGGYSGSVLSLSAMGDSNVGARFRGPWFDLDDISQTEYPFRIRPENRFGETVNSMPPMTNTQLNIPARYGSTTLISSPFNRRGRGVVLIMPADTFTTFKERSTEADDGQTSSLPVYTEGGCACPAVTRGLIFPDFSLIIGASTDDHLGYGAAAGDYNLDGSRDILCGAPNASRTDPTNTNKFVRRGGIVYVIFGRPDWGGVDLGTQNAPRMEIHGVNDDDQFGFHQSIVGDINQDGLPDIAFSSEFADTAGGADSGFIGIVFGGRQLTGENLFTVNQVGTAQLPGCKLRGTQAGGHAGASLSNAGDFNGDGADDMLILAPDETVTINGQLRKGVAYVVFGGPHLVNVSLNLGQIGTSELPGVKIVTPYIVGSADDAPIDSIASAGDINSDGFTDILVGVSRADFVNPLEPSQRRVDAGEMYLIYGSNTGSNAVR